MKPTIFLSLILLTFSHSASAVDKTCINNNELLINKIKLYDSATDALSKLGTPIKVEERHNEDDGGEYLLKIYTYSDLVIEVSRGLVSLIQPLNDKVDSSYGLRIGADLKDVEKNLGFNISAIANKSNPFNVPYCPFGDNENLVIYHDKNVITDFFVLAEGS